jgi:pimeloyl-ACP methyl ester carboxylesterase
VTKRNLFRIAVLAAVAGYFAYSGLLKPAPADGAAKPAARSAPIAANARQFTLGSTTFTSCELEQKNSGATTAAFCAPFSVAENRDKPEGRRIDLKVALIKSEAERADADIVVYLAGGPGESAVQTYPQLEGALAPLRKHHHILLLDQRGTGLSHPLDCKVDDGSKKSRQPPAKDDDATGGEFDPQKFRDQTARCLTDVVKNADPTQYTTTIAAADLEALRQAIGAPQLDLVGVSYGTRMAQQYLMHYPEAVRSMVLDSVVPNELVVGQDFARNLDGALKAQFALCRTNPACAKAFGDPFASLIQLRDALRAKPQDYSFRDPMTFEPVTLRLTERRLAVLVRLFAYSPESAALLPLSIAEGLKGNYTPLAGQTQLLQQDLSADMNGGMQASVICAEDADLLKDDADDASTVLGTSLVDGLRAMCAVWPHGTRPADFHTPIHSATPTLVLEGELDPVTPPRYGEQVIKGLSNARLLVAAGQGHAVIVRGCIPKLVGEFVDTLKVRTLDTQCAEALGPLPALIDFEGAAP